LDIPNVNTLLVFHADRMGLSQLYQLRGRVGRSNRIAYAYFTYQPDKVLSEVAEKRLQAIKEFTELGSGFKIAMRDLAIRGAGNLLGAEQHGFISSVGFDLYSDMLAQAVRELRGEVQEQKPDPNVEVSIEAYIPEEYITDPMQKIEMYKKFVAVGSPADADDLHEEIEDRFGEVPEPVLNLLSVSRIRGYAFLYDLESILKQNQKMVITFRAEQTAKLSGEGLMSLGELTPRLSLSATEGKYAIVLDGRMLRDDQLLALTIRVLEALKKVIQVQGELQNVH
jgi:transcription-repair coupling factor (superfamily II helicase)